MFCRGVFWYSWIWSLISCDSGIWYHHSTKFRMNLEFTKHISLLETAHKAFSLYIKIYALVLSICYMLDSGVMLKFCSLLDTISPSQLCVLHTVPHGQIHRMFSKQCFLACNISFNGPFYILVVGRTSYTSDARQIICLGCRNSSSEVASSWVIRKWKRLFMNGCEIEETWFLPAQKL